jgi:AraC family transcriptional regulator
MSTDHSTGEGWAIRIAIASGYRIARNGPHHPQLAGEVGLSPAHFCTAFKQSAGHSPYRYLLLRKVAYAKQLIKDARLGLTEIALNSGFRSSSQFATIFRRIDGTTPSAFRRSL